MMEEFELKQAKHFDKLIDNYERHHNDKTSIRYRNEFIYDPLFAGLELSGKEILDAMCGTGEATGYLLRREAKVTGLDISAEAIKQYSSKWPSCKTICDSIFSPHLPQDFFDVVVSIGGLHHLHPHVEKSISCIHNLLRRGGRFCFVEPHKGSLFNLPRKLWYHLDRSLFDEGEGAIDLNLLKSVNKYRFEIEREHYFGHVAFLFVMCSITFRIPITIKPYYAPYLMKIESLLEPLNNKYFCAVTMAVWRKI